MQFESTKILTLTRMEQIKLEVGKTYQRRNTRMKLSESTEKIVDISHGYYVGESGICYDESGQHAFKRSGYDLVKEVINH